MLYEFVWKSKSDKVKSKIFEQDYNKGGYKMTSLDNIIKASSVMWIKRYFDSTDRQWKGLFEYFVMYLT